MTNSSAPLLLDIVNHVVLPPKLPHQTDANPDLVEAALASRLRDAAASLKELTTGKLSEEWQRVYAILQSATTLNAAHRLDSTSLLPAFQSLQPGFLLILYIPEQNAGLLIHRQDDGETVVCEAFEASPPCETVLAAKDALQWDFPGSAVVIPFSTFSQASFQEELAQFLQQASTETIKQFGARAFKAGSQVYECRDTPEPTLISSLLMTIFEANGTSIAPVILRKRVRDDVVWSSGAKRPWRRCPLWLVLRVAIERFLRKSQGKDTGRVYYKFFICMMLSRLIGETLGRLDIAMISLLNKKLGRRLAKLEMDKDNANPVDQHIYEDMFQLLTPIFEKVLKGSNDHINEIWNRHKAQSTKRIASLPYNADRGSTTLSLTNSLGYLKRSLASHRKSTSIDDHSQHENALNGVKKAAKSRISIFSNRHLAMIVTEQNILNDPIENLEVVDNHITSLLERFKTIHEFDVQQKSVTILLIMELWMVFDCSTVDQYPLLADFTPAFIPESLDILLLLHMEELERLQKIQTYLKKRHDNASNSGRPLTIFEDPQKGCFAERYFDQSEHLQHLRRMIEQDAVTAKAKKEDEWQRINSRYQELERSVLGVTHSFINDDPTTRRCKRTCHRCLVKAEVDNLQIWVHEHPLPSNEAEAKAAVFELASPILFRAYRNASWNIMRLLFHTEGESVRPKTTLSDFRPLKWYIKNDLPTFSLASKTKSWGNTHYRGPQFPVALDDLFVACGLSLKYFDSSSTTWGSHRPHRPSLVHHFPLHIPKGSPFHSLLYDLDFAVDKNGPSSNSVLASQSKCPTGVSMQEFLSFQALFSGKTRRWISVLLELGSSNLNFSTEATNVLITHLVSQVGPQDGNGHPLRIIHSILDDATFIEQLLEQIRQRVESIASNFRESLYMDSLLTILLRVLSCSCTASFQEKGTTLLERIRSITHGWIAQLREESLRATDGDIAKKCAKYSLWAALLCRRTFILFTESETFDEDIISPGKLQVFTECSFVLHENLGDDPSSLPVSTQLRYIHDLKLIYIMTDALRRSYERHPESLHAAIDTVWPPPEGYERRYSSLQFDVLNSWWMQCSVEGTKYTRSQVLCYNFLTGHLLIDGNPQGTLPIRYKEDELISELFGKRKLLVRQSGLPGMSYSLSYMENGNQFHVGLRDEKAVVKVCIGDRILEVIPRNAFGSPTNFDLPASLMLDCIHFLDLDTGMLEIRQCPDIWIQKHSNWIVDCRKRVAKRRESYLVDPRSGLFRQISDIFKNFEKPCYLTVFQHPNWPVSIEIRRLQLNFVVNRRGLLHCRQLRAFIDRNQDAGTWYGLESKIVMRDSVNPILRSIIVPFGRLSSTRSGHHVAIHVENNGVYGRFAINSVLGRIDCPAEPVLIYTKAMFHAYSSSVVADPLTGRTGTEEALTFLRSAKCQPSTALTLGQLEKLEAIAKLSPRREYYPPGLKKLQEIYWNPEIPYHSQHEEFGLAVEEICRIHNELSQFHPEPIEKRDSEPLGDRYLLSRALASRRKLENNSRNTPDVPSAPDIVFSARDRPRRTQARHNVFKVATLLKRWRNEFSPCPDLVGILAKQTTVGGFERAFDDIGFSDRLNAQLPLEWGSLINFCSACTEAEKYHLMFTLAPIAFRDSINMDAIRAFVAFAILGELKIISPPVWPAYTNFSPNFIPAVGHLESLLEDYRSPFVPDDRYLLLEHSSHKLRRVLDGERRDHERRTAQDCKILATLLLKQWPCAKPSVQEPPVPLLMNISEAMEAIIPEWLRWFQNHELSLFLEDVRAVFVRHDAGQTLVELPNAKEHSSDYFPTRIRGEEILSLAQVLIKPCPLAIDEKIRRRMTSVDDLASCQKLSWPVKKIVQQHGGTFKKEEVSCEIKELELIAQRMIKLSSNVKKQYGMDLKRSLNALKRTRNAQKHNVTIPAYHELVEDIQRQEKDVNDLFFSIFESLKSQNPKTKWMAFGGLLPTITPITLLEQISSTSGNRIGSSLVRAISIFGVSITKLQRLLRIRDAYLKKDEQRLTGEHTNLGHTNWDPLQQLDWLLLEIDANIMLREDQVEVANATIAPPNGSNSVLQLMMGRGKTSCIMPMVATVLADSKQLCRLIVPRALIAQTTQLLVDRLGGLLGRNIRHIHFSRKTPTDLQTMRTFMDIHTGIMNVSGVIVAQPEHILSFRLSGIQRFSDSVIEEAKMMVKAQSWLDRVSRDVLDESDAILATRTQLIYPSGTQSVVDGHPHRWHTVQALLRLVDSHLWKLQQQFPESIEVYRRGGSFPQVFFLRKDVEDALLARLTQDVVRGRQMSIVPMTGCILSDRIAIKRFISVPIVSAQIFKQVSAVFPDRLWARQNIYLLRGLLVHRILLLILKRRWNVQYGLHPQRDPVAVPFHAKGVPSDLAEWGHPDVQIGMTCLSFYYGGINSGQLKQSIEHILRSDDPSVEYDRWTLHVSSLPDSLRDWSVLNVDDEVQLHELWRHFRYCVVAIDYFMNHFVFPRHARQFKIKLQASGWDLPLLAGSPGAPHDTSQQAYNRTSNLSTGFSGTNDIRALLPMTIRQEELPGLVHTNSEVLCYLLEPRNRRYVLAAGQFEKRLPESEFLFMLTVMRIRILIDAGALILEMENAQLALTWLKTDHEASAAIYFNKDNKPWVVYRNGNGTPLSASPYAENIPNDVLVYLDEGHTRGTDLKIHPLAVGALTLGLGNPKDHVVQAAMRLRQLGTTQSVVFFAPPEVHQSILDHSKKQKNETLDSHDVIEWLIEQTTRGIQSLQPLFYNQGINFCQRAQAAINYKDFLSDSIQGQNYLNMIQEEEQQTLEQLYGKRKKAKGLIGDFSPVLQTMVTGLKRVKNEFEDNGDSVHSSALQEVEQEREVQQEVEVVREMQRPQHFIAFDFGGLHRDVIRFVESGRLVTNSASYEDAFGALRRTAIGKKYGIKTQGTTLNLKVTQEFLRTVRVPIGHPNDNFLRPVSFILWSAPAQKAIIISPEEAEEVIAIIKPVKTNPTFLLTYSAPVTRRMLHFSDLDFFAIPPLPKGWRPPSWLVIELSIFAGSVYFSFDQYEPLHKFLGQQIGGAVLDLEADVNLDELNDDENLQDGSKGTTVVQILEHNESVSFTANPLNFMSEWLAIRRRGQEFHNTPMGYVCEGKPLTVNHPFFVERTSEVSVPKSNANIQAIPARQEKRDDMGDGEPDVVDDDEMWDEDAAWVDQEMNEDGAIGMDDVDMDSSVLDSTDGDETGDISGLFNESESQEEVSSLESAEYDDHSIDDALSESSLY